MQGNIAITELPLDREVWLVSVVVSVSQCTARNGKRYYDAVARNGTGGIQVKCWSEVIEKCGELRPGIYGITGRLACHEGHLHFVATGYRQISIETYREHQRGEPPWPLAFTFDVETVPQPRYRERVSEQLRLAYADGTMKADQRERYELDRAAEEERAFRDGALSGTTAEIVAIAVHVAPRAEFVHPGMTVEEYVFGIDEEGNASDERQLLKEFIDFMGERYDPDTSEAVTFVGLNFDAPLVLQRCVAHGIRVPPLFDLASYHSRNVYDVHRKWLMSAKAGRSTLDDLAWALGINSSKSAEVNGRTVINLHGQSRLLEIRRYVRDDARVTRCCYEAIVAALGR